MLCKMKSLRSRDETRGMKETSPMKMLVITTQHLLLSRGHIDNVLQCYHFCLALNVRNIGSFLRVTFPMDALKAPRDSLKATYASMHTISDKFSISTARS